MRDQISDDVRRFILTSIPSVPYLEAMLLLRGEPKVSWDTAALARRLYIPQQTAEELLRQLAEAGFVESGSTGVRYQPAEELGTLVDELARLYAEELVAVTELIHTRQERRARQFADAFRLRQKED
jgi:DNA-binding IclR family transcriptional regulator